ncbi:MAG TPA: DUF58 domain-containing protein [Saprospiraceae bacterium]|nr:DUF58 domain-containing protein [Saprospirales bacterium]HRQ30186.1 DUF58 domain-containing protein [Saprospiraceae bacterium]
MAEAIDILRKIRKIEIKAKGLSKNLFSGDYHSAFKGQGMSFSENRPYAYGDDTKNIDWNVTARTGEAYVKVFEEERELTVILLVDISKSSFFGTKNSFKSDICAEISGVLAFSALSNNDKVGAILFSDVIEKYIPPKKGKSHILRILREIVYMNATGNGTDLGTALKYLNNVLKKRSIVFVISDFITGHYENELRLAAGKHDIIGIHLYDLSEQKLPDNGLVKVYDMENGQQRIIDTSIPELRTGYEKHFADRRNLIKKTFNQVGLDSMEVKVTDDFIKILRTFFKKRIR